MAAGNRRRRQLSKSDLAPVADAADKILALLATGKNYTPETATAMGYVSLYELAERQGVSGPRLSVVLKRRNDVESIRVRTPTGAPQIWYRVKSTA